MAVSDRTRAEVRAELARQAEASQVARGKAEGTRAAVAAEVTERAAVRTTAARIKAHLVKAGGTATRGVLNKGLNSRYRDHVPSALDALVVSGDITIDGRNISLTRSGA